MNTPIRLASLNVIPHARSARHRASPPRRVVLVDFPWTRDKDPRIALGHASLLAALRPIDGVEVRSIILPMEAPGTNAEQAAEAVLAQLGSAPANAVDVAIGAYVWGEDLVQALLPLLRQGGFRGRLILGGPQISYAPDGLEQLYPDADVFVRGYGEAALGELVQTPGRPAIRGVHYAGDVDPGEQSSVDLEALPSPWLDSGAGEAPNAFVRWETQRGCPYRCTFCQHREAGARLVHRSLAFGRITREIDRFLDAGVSDIAVLDPIFNLSPFAIAILERFAAAGFKGRLSVQCRAEALTDPFLDAAARLNVRLELGLQTIHRAEGEAVLRRNQLSKVDAALAAVRRRGLDHEVSLIFGLPLQTLGSFGESVRWCLERQVPVIKAFPLMLLRGTEIERDRDRWGFVDSGGSMPMVVESKSFSREDWLAMARLSDVLQRTEHRHPNTLEELQSLAEQVLPDRNRWMPTPSSVPLKVEPSCPL